MTSSKPVSTDECVLYKTSNGACTGELKIGEGAKYCPLHHPASDRVIEFLEAFDKKVKQQNFNFAWTRFPLPIILEDQEWPGDVDFSHANFTDTVALTKLVFTGSVNFVGAQFNGDAVFRSEFLNRVDFTLHYLVRLT